MSNFNIFDQRGFKIGELRPAANLGCGGMALGLILIFFWYFGAPLSSFVDRALGVKIDFDSISGGPITTPIISDDGLKSITAQFSLTSGSNDNHNILVIVELSNENGELIMSGWGGSKWSSQSDIRIEKGNSWSGELFFGSAPSGTRSISIHSCNLYVDPESTPQGWSAPAKVIPCSTSENNQVNSNSAPTRNTSNSSSQDDCPIETRVQVGSRARVTWMPNRTAFELRLRANPGITSVVTTDLLSGMQMDVISGPVCADQIWWWEVRTQNYQGWVGEGDGSGDFIYNIEPIGN